MRKLFQSDLPVRYPLNNAEFAAAHAKGFNPLIEYKEKPPSPDWETGVFSFSRKGGPEMARLSEERAQHERMVIERGYSAENRDFLIHELAQGGGFNLDRFYRDLEHGDNSSLYGVPYAFHLGNIEGPHGVIFQEMLRRVSAKAHRVLNIGCGPVGFQHANIEGCGITNIAYADIDDEHDTLGTIRRYLDRFGKKDVERSYTVIDKNDTDALKRAFSRQSITAVIRTGVGQITESELDGLNHLLAPVENYLFQIVYVINQ